MEILELQLRVSGHPLLDSEAEGIIAKIRDFRPLALRERAILLQDVQIGVAYSMSFQVGDAAVIIDRQWGVSIYADNLRQCVFAMLVLENEIERELDSKVSIDMIDVPNPNRLSLADALERRERDERWKRRLWQFVAIASLLLSLLAFVSHFVGGLLS